jgi:hypothetical protein
MASAQAKEYHTVQHTLLPDLIMTNSAVAAGAAAAEEVL